MTRPSTGLPYAQQCGHHRARQGVHATLVDVTSAYAVFDVMGPRSRDLLATLTPADLSDDAFPFGTSQQISLGADWGKAGTYQVNVGGQLLPITASLKPSYDPTNEKVRPGHGAQRL